MIKTFLIAAAIASMIGTATAQDSQNIAPAFDMQRCVNMGNSLEAPRSGEWGAPIELPDFRKIKAAGFDTVRIPVRWSEYTGSTPNYEIDADFMANVQTTVSAALDADLNVILNIHHFEEIMQQPRAEMKHLLAMWRQIGVAFADAPDSLWFEALNEPHTELKGTLMQAAQTAAILGIRETNPDRIIIIGGEDWSGINSLVTNIAPTDNNIVYTFHYYDPFDFTHQEASWLGDAMPKGTRGWGSRQDKDELASAVSVATSFKEAVGHPVFLGEFGVYDAVKASERVEWTAATREAYEEAGIPWCVWAFTNTFPIYSRESGWDPEMLSALGLEMPSEKSAARLMQPKIRTSVLSRTDITPEQNDWGTFLKYFEGVSSGTHNVLTGVAEIKAGWEIHPPHVHSEEEYLMVVEGEGTWTINGESFPAKPGDMLYAAPWESHGIRNTGDTTLKFVFWKWQSSGIPEPTAPFSVGE